MSLTLIFRKRHAVDHLNDRSTPKQVWDAMEKTSNKLVEDGKHGSGAIHEARERALDKIGKGLVAPGETWENHHGQ